jgi:hypothetical protein
VGAFGAGISLAIAGSLALLVVSSVIAFRGWPDDLNGSRVPDVAELSSAPGGASASARSVTAAVTLPRAVSPTASARGVKAGGGSGAGAVTVAGGEASSVRGAAGPSSSPSSSAAVSSSGVSAKPVVKHMAGTVRDTRKVAADAVAPVAPAASGALQSIGAAGGGVVDQAAKTVDGAAGSVLP